jgi:hypothetical protein
VDRCRPHSHWQLAAGTHARCPLIDATHNRLQLARRSGGISAAQVKDCKIVPVTLQKGAVLTD